MSGIPTLYLMFKKNNLSFLGLTENENRVLAAIRKKPKTIFLISADTTIPRANIYLLIKKLYDRGFIQVKCVGRRYTYQATETKKLKEVLVKIASSL